MGTSAIHSMVGGLSYRRHTRLMQIYTSYYANYKEIEPDYQCVAISNSTPIRIPKWKDVVPNWQLVQQYKAGLLLPEQFSLLYRQQLDRCNTAKLYEYLQQFSYPVVLMCYEKDDRYCHRAILRDYLLCMLGVKCTEL